MIRRALSWSSNHARQRTNRSFVQSFAISRSAFLLSTIPVSVRFDFQQRTKALPWKILFEKVPGHRHPRDHFLPPFPFLFLGAALLRDDTATIQALRPRSFSA